MGNAQKDPLQTIAAAIKPLVAPMGIVSCGLGWPDPSKFTVDGALPLLAIWSVHEKGQAVVSREQIHAAVPNPDGITQTVYTEQQRLFFTLQFSLFTKTEEDRSNIGWAFQQHFTTLDNIQVPIGSLGSTPDGTPVETALFQKWLGKRDSQGETGFFRRDMSFEVTARVLDATTAYTAKIIQTNQKIGSAPIPTTPNYTTPDVPTPTT